jgi:hypothetical protein
MSSHRKCGDDCVKPFDLVIKCTSCDAICHNTCYGLNKTVVKAIHEIENIVFLCDECSDTKTFVASDSTNSNNAAQVSDAGDNTAIFHAIGELKNMVVDMQTKINKIEKPTYSKVVTGDVFKSSGPRNKRLRVDGDTISTPTGRPQNGIVGNGDDTTELSSVETRKWIFVSQLHPSTTDTSFTDYVKKRLNDTSDKLKIQAFALVPKDRDRNELNFISFELNIPESSFVEVLKPEIWPKGVVVREFVNDSRRRRPTGHFLPKTPMVDLL